MTYLHTLLIEARERGKEPKLVEGLEKLIAELSLLTPYDAAGKLQERWSIRSEQGRPWEEPGEMDWMDIGNHRWACDGAIAFREDAPRPLWRRLDDDFGSFRDKAPQIRRWLGHLAPAGEWTGPVAFSPRFAPMLRKCPAIPHGTKITLGACRQDGEIIAIVMPLRRGCRGVGPAGLPVAAGEEAPGPPVETWTDADVKRLRSLGRKRKRQLNGSPAHLSDDEGKELSALQQKKERCVQ